MIKVVTVCGNGIGSSLILKLKLEEIAKENQIEIDAESIDSNAAAGKVADLFVTVKEFADVFKDNQKVVFTRSYMNKKKIKIAGSLSTSFKNSNIPIYLAPYFFVSVNSNNVGNTSSLIFFLFI